METNNKTAPISRGLDRNQMERLLSLDFIHQGQNLFITGSTGTGKSFIATAIGYQACKAGIRTLYANTSKLLGSLKVAKAKGTLEAELKKIERCPPPTGTMPSVTLRLLMQSRTASSTQPIKSSLPVRVSGRLTPAKGRSKTT